MRHRRPPAGKESIRLILAAVGVVLLIDPRNASFSSQTTIGDILIISNSLAYGIYVATSKETITINGGSVNDVDIDFRFDRLCTLRLFR